MGCDGRASLGARWALLAAALIVAGCGHAAPMSARARIDSGWAQFQSGEWDLAQSDFSQARTQSDPNSSEYRQATYGAGIVWQCRRPGENRALSRQMFEDVVARAPQSDEAAWSLLALARQQQLVPVGQAVDWDAVRKAYGRVIEEFPSHQAAEEAFIDLQCTFVLSLVPADARQAEAALKEFLAAHPESKFTSTAWGLLAACYQTLDEPRRRLDCEIKALQTRETDASNPTMNASGSYWTIATIAQYDVGDFQTARKYYRKFVQEFPNDQRTFGAMQAIQKMDQLEQQFRTEAAAAAARGQRGSS